MCECPGESTHGCTYVWRQNGDVKYFIANFFFSKTLLLNLKIIDSATLTSQIDPRIPCLCLTFQELQELGGPSFHMHP